MYFKVFITQGWCKKTGEGRRRFDQRLPRERALAAFPVNFRCVLQLYVISVHQARGLPLPFLRFRLTTDTLGLGCNLPAAGRFRVSHPLEHALTGRTTKGAVSKRLFLKIAYKISLAGLLFHGNPAIYYCALLSYFFRICILRQHLFTASNSLNNNYIFAVALNFKRNFPFLHINTVVANIFNAYIRDFITFQVILAFI